MKQVSEKILASSNYHFHFLRGWIYMATTERERIERTYKKVKEKHPDVTDKDELRRLAVRFDVTRMLFVPAIVVAAAIIIGVSIHWIYPVTLTLICFAIGVPRALIIAKKRFYPIPKVEHKGTLTKEIVQKDANEYRKKEDTAFRIVKAPLWDKENSGDSDSDSPWFFFKFRGYDIPFRHYPGNMKIYTDAVIGEDYYVVMSVDSPDKRMLIEGILRKNTRIIAEEYHPYVLAVYKASEYDVAEELLEFFDREMEKKAIHEAVL